MCFVHRADEKDEDSRLLSLITRWMNHDLECSLTKLATAVGKVRGKHAGPAVAKRFLQKMRFEPGTYVRTYLMMKEEGKEDPASS